VNRPWTNPFGPVPRKGYGFCIDKVNGRVWLA